MSKWIADREPPLSSSLCLWSSRPSPLRATHARFTMRRAIGAISEWGLGRGARRQIQSDRELRCACHRVRRGVRRRLRRLAGHGRPHKGDRQRPGDGVGRTPNLAPIRHLDPARARIFALAADILRTAVAPTWDDISKLAVIATIRTMLNYFLAKTSWPSTRARKLARKGAQPRQNQPESGKLRRC